MYFVLIKKNSYTKLLETTHTCQCIGDSHSKSNMDFEGNKRKRHL